MKLTPAEDWALDGYIIEPQSSFEERLAIRIKFIQKIQADALRFAIEFSSKHQFGAFTAFSDLEKIANQLHPLSESKRKFNLET